MKLKNNSKYLILLLVFLSLMTQGQEKPKLSVLIFFHPECPICQKMTLPIKQISSKYDLNILIIYSDKYLNTNQINEFNKLYDFRFAFKLDKKKKIAAKYNILKTPEVVLILNKKILYQGAINNWFLELGKYTENPSENYLEEAILSTLKNEPIKIKKTNAVGCYL